MLIVAFGATLGNDDVFSTGGALVNGKFVGVGRLYGFGICCCYNVIDDVCFMSGLFSSGSMWVLKNDVTFSRAVLVVEFLLRKGRCDGEVFRIFTMSVSAC